MYKKICTYNPKPKLIDILLERYWKKKQIIFSIYWHIMAIFEEDNFWPF